MSCSVFTVPPGAHVFLKKCKCVHTRRRLQWIVIDCKRNLQRRHRKLAQKMSVHILEAHPEHLNRVYTCSPPLRRPLVIIVPFCGVWSASVNYRSPRSWPLLSALAQMYCLTCRLGVRRAVRCTWAQWQWKLVHSPYQHPSRTKSSQVSPCLSWIQLLFTDSLTSTLLDWLS